MHNSHSLISKSITTSTHNSYFNHSNNYSSTNQYQKHVQIPSHGSKYSKGLIVHAQVLLAPIANGTLPKLMQHSISPKLKLYYSTNHIPSHKSCNLFIQLYQSYKLAYSIQSYKHSTTSI